MHGLARVLSQGPNQCSCFACSIAGFGDDAATTCGVRAIKVGSKCENHDWSRLLQMLGKNNTFRTQPFSRGLYGKLRALA